MNVASSVPSSALEKISRKMYRPSSRSTTYPLPRHVRRGNHRQLRQFFFRRMQFQVVDQDRGGHHAGLCREAGAADQRKRRVIILVFEGRAIVARRQDVLQRAHIESAEAHAAHQFLAPVQINLVDQDGHAHRPASLLALIRRRTSSMPAVDGKSILRTMIPYGLLRVRHKSISFFFSSATVTGSLVLTNRLLMAAALAP